MSNLDVASLAPQKIQEFSYALDTTQQDPKKVLIMCPSTRELPQGCPWCAKATQLAVSQGLMPVVVTDSDEMDLKFYNPRANIFTPPNDPAGTYRSWPKIFMNGQFVGGYDKFSERMASPPPPPSGPPFLRQNAPTGPPSSSRQNAPAGQQPPNGPPPAGPRPPASQPPLRPTTADTLQGAQDFVKQTPPAVAKPGGPPPLEEGLFAGVERELNWQPIVDTIGSNLDPMYGDLKKCMCEGFAEIFIKSSPVLVEQIVETVIRTAEEDPYVHQHLERRIVQLINEVKASADKETVLRNLDGECRAVFVQLDRQSSRGTRKQQR